MSCGCDSGCSTCGECKFVTYKGKGCGTFVVPAGNLCFFDSVTEIQVAAVGTDIEYWSQDMARGTRDPLYDEPLTRAWRGPFKFKGFVEHAPAQMESREEGFRVTWDGSVFLPRKAVEDSGAPPPKAGDVVRYWRNKYFAHEASGGADDPGAGMFFDVVNVDSEGHTFDSANFVGFKLRVVRRTEFAPERRLGG